MNAALNLLPLLAIAALVVTFVIQFFAAHSRTAAWAAPASPSLATTASHTVDALVLDLDEARTARQTRTVEAAA